MDIVKNGTLVGWLDKLNALSKQDVNVPVKIAYAITKNRQNIETALKPYDEMRQKIVDKYSGGTGVIDAKSDPQKFKSATADLNALLNEDTSINIRKVKIEDFYDIEFPIKAMFSIDFMLE